MRKLLIPALIGLLPMLSAAQSAPLNQSQLAALCVAAKANASINAARVLGDTVALASLLDAPAVPDFVVERTAITRHEILTRTSSTGSTFQWAGAGYITRAQGERDAFREMFNSTGSVNPSLAAIKAAFNDIFSGTGNAAANRAHIQALSKRKSTFLERVFATGTGTDATPGTLVVEGPASSQAIDYLVNSATCN